MISRRTVSPFDAEAKERLRHMGLLDVQDKANKEVIRAAAQLHAGMFVSVKYPGGLKKSLSKGKI